MVLVIVIKLTKMTMIVKTIYPPTKTILILLLHHSPHTLSHPRPLTQQNPPPSHHHPQPVHQLPTGGCCVLRPLAQRRRPELRPVPVHGADGGRGAAGLHAGHPPGGSLRQEGPRSRLLLLDGCGSFGVALCARRWVRPHD